MSSIPSHPLISVSASYEEEAISGTRGVGGGGGGVGGERSGGALQNGRSELRGSRPPLPSPCCVSRFGLAARR